MQELTFRTEGGISPLKSTLISGSIALIVVPADLLAADGTVNILATNPAPGGDSTPVALTVTSGGAIQSILNSASNVAGVVSPGAIVTLFGEGIGTTDEAASKDDDGDDYVDAPLSGVTASINGVAAPVLYVAENQVTIQAPYDIFPLDNVPVIVDNGTAQATGAVRVAPYSPGIFTQDGTGSGTAAAMNYVGATNLYTLHSQSAPAKVGDTLVL
jgi:hypothetical protein